MYCITEIYGRDAVPMVMAATTVGMSGGPCQTHHSLLSGKCNQVVNTNTEEKKK